MAGFTPIKVLLVEDHPLTRAGLRFALKRFSEVEVVGEAVDGLDAVEKTASLRPDVVVMDVSMPRLDGLEATRRLKSGDSQVKVVLLTCHDTPDALVFCLASGADGYCLKENEPEALVKVLLEVADGKCWIDAVVAQSIQLYISDRDGQKIGESWSAMDRKIVERLALGLEQVTIAEQLNCTTSELQSSMKKILSSFRDID